MFSMVVVPVLSIIAILTGVRWHLIVVLISISLIASEVKYIFICHIFIGHWCVFLGEVPVQVLCTFLIGFFVVKFYEFFMYFGY